MITVGFFPECDGHPTDPALVVPSVSLLPHHTLTFRRKFITLKRLVMDATRWDTFVAIGPVHAENSCSHGYAHKEIGKLVLLPDEFKITGGGWIEFHGEADHEGKIRWRAEFDGYSGEFGKFSPFLLLKDNLKMLVEILKMHVRVTYSDGERKRDI